MKKPTKSGLKRGFLDTKRDMPETPSANLPETPSANLPETPSANLPETPSANLPETSSANLNFLKPPKKSKSKASKSKAFVGVPPIGTGPPPPAHQNTLGFAAWMVSLNLIGFWLYKKFFFF
jgi:hypothetical protein